MANRLEHLQLATPPYATPYATPTYVANEFLNQVPSNEYCFTNDWNLSCENDHVTQLELFDQSNLFISLNEEGNDGAPTQDKTTPPDYEFEATPTDDVSIIDEENDSDSFDKYVMCIGKCNKNGEFSLSNF